MVVKTLDELNYLEKLGLTRISYSRLDTYEQCPARYFYTYIAREPRVFGEYAVMGNIIHSTLENVLEKEVPVDYPTLKKEFVNQGKEWDPDKQINDKLYEAGDVMLNEFFDRHEDEMMPIDTKEASFNIVVGGALIRGYIDRVDIEGDTVKVIDYKSGSREVSFKKAPTNLQLGIYALAMSHKYPDKEIYAELYYLRSGRRKGHLFSKDDLLEVEDKLIALTKELITTENFSYTANKGICSFCDHRKNGSCSVGIRRYGRD